jgi:hypothetical protein
MKKIASLIFEQRALFALGLVVLVAIGVTEYKYANGSLLRLIDLTFAGLLATPTWEIPIDEGFTELLHTEQGLQDLARWIAIDGGIAILAGAVNKSIQRVVSDARSERRRLGIEPIKRDENVSHVIIGAPEIISDFAQVVARHKNEKVVGIHLGDTIPYSYGQEIDHHINVSGLGEIVGRFSPATKEISTIEASGIDRANTVTIVCINPDNALFYHGFGSEVSADFPSTLLRRIDPEKLKGKRVNLVLPEVRYLGRTTAIENELSSHFYPVKFDLRITKPEELVLNWIAHVLRNAKTSDGLKLVLIGEGKEQRDREMLEYFETALDHLTVASKRAKTLLITQNLIQNNNATVEISKEPGGLLSILSKSDLIICYGDTDFGTSTMVRLLLAQKIQPEKILAIVERKDMAFDYANLGIPEKNIFFVYQAIIDAVA